MRHSRCCCLYKPLNYFVYHLGCSYTIYYQVLEFILHEGHCNQDVSISICVHTLRQGTLAPEKLSALKSNGLANGIQNENSASAGVSVETIAATRIQTAFRAYKVS